MNAKEKNTSKPTYSIEPITGTPFAMIKNEEGYFMVLGNTRITESYETQEEAFAITESDMWSMVARVASIIAENIVKEVLKKK